MWTSEDEPIGFWGWCKIFIISIILAAFILLWFLPPAKAEDAPPLTREEPVVRMVLQEANTESLAGKVVVAGVALDRAADRRWPSTPRDVVYQGNHSTRTAQFTGMAISLRRYTDKDIDMARLAVELARTGTRPCGTVLWYHTDYIKLPHWTKAMTERCRIGAHIFYADVDKVG